MSTGSARYDVKAQAGWSRTRRDGSEYERATDEHAADAEQWFAAVYGGVANDAVHLRGDEGYDVVVDRRGCALKVDVVHAGVTAHGPRPGCSSCLIVNADSNKLIASDLLVFVEGPPFVVVGCIYTARFHALATLRDHGHGCKLSLPSARLMPIDYVMQRRQLREPGEEG